jgi:acyl-CoA thioesterase FadM
MGFMSRWPVLRRHAVTAGDLDAGGAVRDEAVARWADDVRAAYLELLPTLRRAGLSVRVDVTALPRGTALGHPDQVVLTAGGKEVLPASFLMGVRLRPIGGEGDTALDWRYEIHLEDGAGHPAPLTDDIRDELIALEHAAAHFN